jgi:lipopolysaccharide transport system ATP-binding protein
MSSTVIRAEGLGKQYRVGERERYLALRDILMRVVRSPLNFFRPARSELMWALRDVSFQVEHGEVIGIIGRNGAGKTTLLKILSRVTRPTVGFAEVRGRMGSLLEVGTGFHPELTGRENMYLSGAILGMSKQEIRRKFDTIVAFAGVDRFIDTPLKHYSTGMQMRLAFAVAAHLESDILFVDEVLAVGDLSFQKKCLAKMGEVAHAGRTIVFVSHNLSAINTLCPRSILMERGRVVLDGNTSDVLTAYHAGASGIEDAGTDLTNRIRTGTGRAFFRSIALQPLGPDGESIPVFRPGGDLLIDTEIESRGELRNSYVAAIIYDAGGYRLVDINTAKKAEFVSLRAGERARIRFVIRELLLKPGTYVIGLWLGRDSIEEVDNLAYAATLEVAPSSDSSKSVTIWPGPYVCRFESSISSLQESVVE